VKEYPAIEQVSQRGKLITYAQASLLRGRPDGIFVAEFEQGEIGPDLFRAACNMGLEGMVSKRADRPYRAGRSKDWIKVKNRKHPAYRRVQDRF
jgi:hypothetical protein